MDFNLSSTAVLVINNSDNNEFFQRRVATTSWAVTFEVSFGRLVLIFDNVQAVVRLESGGSTAFWTPVIRATVANLSLIGVGADDFAQLSCAGIYRHRCGCLWQLRF